MKFNYPALGDPPAPEGVLILLTRGGIPIIGIWGEFFIAWAPMPERDPVKESQL